MRHSTSATNSRRGWLLLTILILLALPLISAVGWSPIGVQGFVEGTDSATVSVEARQPGTGNLLFSGPPFMANGQGGFVNAVTIEAAEPKADLYVTVRDTRTGAEYTVTVPDVPAFGMVSLNFSLRDGAWTQGQAAVSDTGGPVGDLYKQIDAEIDAGVDPLDIAEKYDIPVAEGREVPARVETPAGSSDVHIWLMILVFVLILVLIHVTLSKKEY